MQMKHRTRGTQSSIKCTLKRKRATYSLEILKSDRASKLKLVCTDDKRPSQVTTRGRECRI